MLQGRVSDRTFIIYDSLPLNAQASETTVQLSKYVDLVLSQ